MAAALKWSKDQVSIYCSYPRSTPVLQAMYSCNPTTPCKTKSFYLSIPKQPANTRQTLRQFFKPWPPVNFHINRGDFLLKIRGCPWGGRVHGPGPWGGPWIGFMGWSMDPGPCFVYVRSITSNTVWYIFSILFIRDICIRALLMDMRFL